MNKCYILHKTLVDNKLKVREISVKNSFDSHFAKTRQWMKTLTAITTSKQLHVHCILAKVFVSKSTYFQGGVATMLLCSYLRTVELINGILFIVQLQCNVWGKQNWYIINEMLILLIQHI